MKANVGMKYPVAAVVDTYTAGTSITYENGFVISKARGANVTWESNDGEFYGDDVLLDSDKSFTGYTISFEPAGLKSAVRAKLLGETKDSNDAYTISAKNPPDVGFGYIKINREDDEDGIVETTIEAFWYYKVKFRLESDEARTKEKGLEWRVPTLNGTGAGVYLSADAEEPDFATHKDFETVAAAKTWLESMANIQAATTT